MKRSALINRAARLPAAPPSPPADDVEGRVRAKVAGMTTGQRHARMTELRERFAAAEGIDPRDTVALLRRHVERAMERGDAAKARRWMDLLRREERKGTPATRASGQTARDPEITGPAGATDGSGHTK